MARPKINYEDKRQSIIQLAFELFMEKGYESTSINDILKAANLSKGGLYHYFESKEDILDSVLAYLIDIDIKRAQPFLENHEINPWEKILVMINNPTPEHSESEEIQQANEYAQKRPYSIFDYRAKELSAEASVSFLARIIGEGIASGDFQTDLPEEMAEILYGATQSSAIWIQKNPSREKALREIESLVFLFRQCLQIGPEKCAELRAKLMLLMNLTTKP